MQRIWETSHFKEIYNVNTTDFECGKPCLRVYTFCHSKSNRGWLHNAEIKQSAIIAFLILSGNMQMISNDGRKEVIKDGFFVMSPLNAPVGKLRTLSVEAERYFILLEMNTLLTAVTQAMFPGGLPKFYSPAPAKLKVLFENIRDRIVENGAEDSRIGGAAYSLLHEVMNQLPANNLPLPLLLANDYIASNFAKQSLSREEIANHAMVSVSTLASLFRKHLNTTIWDCVCDRRMEAVKQFLTFSNKNIVEIAFLCGFSYAYYLTREFKARFGCTPTEYRRSRYNSKGK